ncbi:hypothetical protein KY284_026700 [Solanum tuberosum]|nr:hypothetical protein KY284_026700 [Solanum tuberosum]
MKGTTKSLKNRPFQVDLRGCVIDGEFFRWPRAIFLMEEMGEHVRRQWVVMGEEPEAFVEKT